MGAQLPEFVSQLLAQSREPDHVPDIAAWQATRWLSPLASRLLPLLDTSTSRTPGAFHTHGYTYLRLRTPDDFTVYLRVSDTRAMTPWRVHAPAVVLSVAGVATLEMYRCPDDVKGGRPQYTRVFGAEEFFAVHPGTLCATRGTVATVQVLAATEPVTGREGPLSGAAYASAARRARRHLELASIAPAGAACRR